jgi:hypothetical protein
MILCMVLRLNTEIGEELRKSREQGTEVLWLPTLSAEKSGKDGARGFCAGDLRQPFSDNRSLIPNP